MRSGAREDRAIDESYNEALARLRQDYVRGAIDAEEYSRLREQVRRGGQAPTFEDRPSVNIPESVDPWTNAQLASWKRRAAGWLIDAVVFAAVIAPTFAFVIGPADPGTRERFAALELIAFPILYPWVTVGIWGGTLGMLAVGIRVRRSEDAQPIGFMRALGRAVSAFALAVLGILALVLISYLWPLWDRRNQTLHDKMANTIVVMEPESTHPSLAP